jgi:hypothetical protein
MKKFDSLPAALAIAMLALGLAVIFPQAVAGAGGPCGYANANNRNQQACVNCIMANHSEIPCGVMEWATPSPTGAPAAAPPQNGPVNPPPPSVQAPKVNAPGAEAPKNASLLKPPKGLDAPPDAVAAAKNAPSTQVDPANPPKPPTQQDFHQQVQNVISAHGGNVDVVKAGNQALVRPRHWNWVDYDADHHPTLYNPLTEAMTFRYVYNGARQEVYVAAGARVVLDVSVAGVFPYTAVSDSYVASGSFYGGTTPPAVYQNVSAIIPAANQTVQVGQVTAVGHDPNQPAGSQDTFMLDDSTLAWGQANDPRDGGQITVTKTQPLPGVGPTDDGGFLIALTAHEESTDNWWPWALGGGVLVIAAGLLAWFMVRRRQGADAQ